MRENMVNALKDLCNKKGTILCEIENFIIENKLTREEISIAGILILKWCVDERLVIFSDRRKNHKLEAVLKNLPRMFELFLKYGLEPNYIYDGDSMLGKIKYLWSEIAPEVLKILMEAGGDANLIEDGESIFESLDFDVVFDVVELDNNELFRAEVLCWFVLIGYGGRISNGTEPVTMLNGYTKEVFKEYDGLDYEIEFLQSDWIMHIRNKYTGEEVAFL